MLCWVHRTTSCVCALSPPRAVGPDPRAARPLGLGHAWVAEAAAAVMLNSRAGLPALPQARPETAGTVRSSWRPGRRGRRCSAAQALRPAWPRSWRSAAAPTPRAASWAWTASGRRRQPERADPVEYVVPTAPPRSPPSSCSVLRCPPASRHADLCGNGKTSHRTRTNSSGIVRGFPLAGCSGDWSRVSVARTAVVGGGRLGGGAGGVRRGELPAALDRSRARARRGGARRPRSSSARARPAR